MKYDKVGLPTREYYTEELKKSAKDKLPNLQQYCGMWDSCQIDTVNEIDLRHVALMLI